MTWREDFEAMKAQIAHGQKTDELLFGYHVVVPITAVMRFAELVMGAVDQAAAEAAELARKKVIQALAVWSHNVASHARMEWQGMTLVLTIDVSGQALATKDRDVITKGFV